ncbi:MAG: PEP-CTERM sorting domain-containing protein [Planctomycetes bacterium]|nr:PEP-CTERM sorting domain-containing protein [Planctomycetota bacterium]
MESRSIGLVLVSVMLFWGLLAGSAGAATVTPQVLVNFDGTISGTTYTLGAGELDTTGSFAASRNAQVVSGGQGFLNHMFTGGSQGGEGFFFNGPAFNTGGTPNTDWIMEMRWTPTAGYNQSHGQAGSLASMLAQGGHGTLRYVSPTPSPSTVQTNYWDGGTDHSFNAATTPTAGVANHAAVVFDNAANRQDYYLNGVLIGSAGGGTPNPVNSNDLFGFGQEIHPATTGQVRGTHGFVDAVAFSTFTGAFAPGSDFQLDTAQGTAASSIGVNFSTSTGEDVTAAQEPGVVAGANWNNVGVTTGVTTSDLQDNSGAATTADVTLNSALTWNFGNGTTGDAGFNTMVNRGVFGAGNGGADDEVSITFDEIPYDLYDVYVFAQSRTTAGNDLSVTIGDTTFYYDTDGSGAADEIAQIVSTTAGSPTAGGSFALFEGLSGDSFTLTTDGSVTGAISNNVFGVHVVERVGAVPEPSTLVLLTLGSLGLLWIRRRKKA